MAGARIRQTCGTGLYKIVGTCLHFGLNKLPTVEATTGADVAAAAVAIVVAAAFASRRPHFWHY